MPSASAYRYLLFDLDGTLTDSKPGIITSLRFALSHFVIGQPTEKDLADQIGVPLREIFRSTFQLSESDTQQAIALYRDHYRKIGSLQNRVYDGTEKVLSRLAERGLRLAIVTSKAEVIAQEILKHFHLEHFFHGVFGMGLDYQLVHKDELIKNAMTYFADDDPEHYLMIGDRRQDIIGAQKNGIASVGALYGYGSDQELREAGADYLISRLSEVESLLP